MLYPKTRTGACLPGQRFSLCNVSLNLGSPPSQPTPGLILFQGKAAPGTPVSGTQTAANWRVVVNTPDLKVRLILVTSVF